MDGIHVPAGVPHYYGDYIRRLFIAAVVISAVAMPLWGNLLPFGLLFQLIGALIFILLAGLTNPSGRSVLIFDAIAASIGVLLLEYNAVQFYHTESIFLFLAREAEAVMLVFAFYFSIKTLRAMAQGKVGHAEHRRKVEEPPSDH